MDGWMDGWVGGWVGGWTERDIQCFNPDASEQSESSRGHSLGLGFGWLGGWV